jgi:hypothetical protein
MKERTKELEKYKDEYILFSGNKVVAHDKDILKILKTSEKYPLQDARITRALSDQANFF